MDTDQIMPRQFLNRMDRGGFGEFLFFERKKDPHFVLNDPRFIGAKFLLGGRNFGSGSSRESAVWGLQQYGFEAVIAPSFSDIFVGNCVQSGLVPATVSQSVIDELMAVALEDAGTIIDLSLLDYSISWAMRSVPFELDFTLREVLILGQDDISLILQNRVELEAYEQTRATWLPRSIDLKSGNK